MSNAYDCEQCERTFSTYQGLCQHIDMSSAHLCWECEVCEKQFGSPHALYQHRGSAANHYYCNDHERGFANDNNLKHHRHSKAHGCPIACVNCSDGPFPTLSAWLLHVESGRCGTTWRDVNKLMRRLDPHNIFTLELDYYAEDQSERIATEDAWNPMSEKFECSMCDNGFNTLTMLENHSAGHAPKNYHCPGCDSEHVKLGGLMQHIESEACAFMNFDEVQKFESLEDIASGIEDVWRMN